MTRERPSSVTWAGVVIRLSDGTVHAVEFNRDFITADLKIGDGWSASDFFSVWLQGYGRYWTEGAKMAPERVKEIESKREIEG